jgi:D-alanine-D-alanine ligase
MSMNSNKIMVGILFGGKSAEHEVSLQSAQNAVEALDRSKFEPVLIGIGKNGAWSLCDDVRLLRGNGENLVALPPEQGVLCRADPSPSGFPLPKLDVILPILHGPFGEDGTVQGLLKLAGIPFAGPGVLGSAVGMDKDVMKRLLRDAGIPIGKFLVFASHEPFPSFADVVSELSSPVFVKPANMGSSVGITMAHNEQEFAAALKTAFQYDTKIVIEESIKGREIECAVLGNENPSASLPGEIIPLHGFYSYDAKYLDEDGARLEIPAKLDAQTQKRIQDLSVRVFKVLCCQGLSRIDFFLREDGEILVNEINTMPGFTKISMYPKLWEASGISYSDLISRLIDLAMERHKKEQALKITYD